MLNCKQATLLMSQGMDRKLGSLQRVGLRLHLTMCSGCRNFNKQMVFLNESCRRLSQPDHGIRGQKP